jgi:hypothetical protein
MARAYQEKKTSTKLLEGLVAGLLGGVVSAVVIILADLLLRSDHPWWYTPSLIGSLVTGTPQDNVAQPGAPFIIGLLIHLVLFALAGIGLTFYAPIFRRFRINEALAGAIYGGIIWLFVFFLFFNSIKPDISHMVNNWALFVACVLGGAAIGWWLRRTRQ